MVKPKMCFEFASEKISTSANLKDEIKSFCGFAKSTLNASTAKSDQNYHLKADWLPKLEHNVILANYLFKLFEQFFPNFL